MLFSKFKRIINTIRLVKENNLYTKEILRAHVFQSSISNCLWLNDKSFSPGGWAVDFSLLYTLFRVLNDVKPKNIMEFGLGQSTKMIHQYKNYFDDTYALTIEHDEKWVAFFKQGLNSQYNINVGLCDLKSMEFKGHSTLGYTNVSDKIGTKKFDLILVDGPFGTERFSRSQIMELIPDSLGHSFCIIMDDTNRLGEKETFNELCRLFNKMNIKFLTKVYGSIKEHSIICSPDLQFLITL